MANTDIKDNGTGKAPVDKIREDIKRFSPYINFELGEPEIEMMEDYRGCYIDYLDFVKAFKSQQAEIERLEKKIPIVSVDRSEICFDGKGYTEDEQIERLKAKLEAMRCCGNCGVENRNTERCFHCKRNETARIKATDILLDNWQPKEDN